MNYKKAILENICYTELVYGRINKKLGLSLSKEDIEEFVCAVISETDNLDFQKRCKNIYTSNRVRNVRLTINSYNYRIITADRLKS